jgi:hypothetical protein
MNAVAMPTRRGWWIPQKKMLTAKISGSQSAWDKPSSMLSSKDIKRLKAMNQGLTGNNKASRRLMIMALCLC